MTHHPSLTYYEATARQRINSLVDEHSFIEYLGPELKYISPHLKLFDLPEQFDDGIVIGKARLDKRPILIAAQEGRFMGGAIGEVHGAKLLGLIKAAQTSHHDLVLLLDTGGVRLQEANAGEIAIAEIMRAMIEARQAGSTIIAVIGGRAGCYGGGSIIAACASKIIMSEHGRMSVSGPEVIETNKGVEEFDARDRALVWRTMGGKHRYIMKDADIFVEDDIHAFRHALIHALNTDGSFSQAVVVDQQNKLAARLDHFGQAKDAVEIWGKLGITNSQIIPDLQTSAFISIADKAREKLTIKHAVNKTPSHAIAEKLQHLIHHLFGRKHHITMAQNLLLGEAEINSQKLHIIGIANGASLTVDDACALSQSVLDIIAEKSQCPIIVLIDSSSQNMSKRDELLGLNQYLAQLAKSLFLAAQNGHRTIGILYGSSAAGAFIASALATQTLIALPDAYPAVMDLPSMARVTKLSVDMLQEMAKTTPVFAPGLENLFKTGAIVDVWPNDDRLNNKLAALIDDIVHHTHKDIRAQTGFERKGRMQALPISQKIEALALE